MGCHRNFWAIVKYIFEIHGSIFKPNKIWKSHLPFQQYMNKEPRFQISAKSDNVWRKYITFSGSRSWIYLEVAVHYTAAPRCFYFCQLIVHGKKVIVVMDYWRSFIQEFLSSISLPLLSYFTNNFPCCLFSCWFLLLISLYAMSQPYLQL